MLGLHRGGFHSLPRGEEGEKCLAVLEPQIVLQIEKVAWIWAIAFVFVVPQVCQLYHQINK